MSAPRIRRPLAIWPNRSDAREGKAYSFTLSRTDGAHVTIEDYLAVRDALGMSELSVDEVRDIFAPFPRLVDEQAEVAR